eukprot:646639-Pelagomonas_calceolata.AAC.7
MDGYNTANNVDSNSSSVCAEGVGLDAVLKGKSEARRACGALHEVRMCMVSTSECTLHVQRGQQRMCGGGRAEAKHACGALHNVRLARPWQMSAR